MNCYICTKRLEFGDTTDEPKPATHMCSELGREICADHAAYCAEDGHEAIPLADRKNCAIRLTDDAPDGYTVADAIKEQAREDYLDAKRRGEDC